MEDIVKFFDSEKINYTFDDNILYINTSDVGKYCDYKQLRSVTRSLSNNYKKSFINKTNGGNQLTTYISLDGLKCILSKSRKNKSKFLADIVGMKVHDNLYVNIESETIAYISKCFQNENFTLQFGIDKYFIDLYFTEYKLAIECDEEHHNCSMIMNDDSFRQNKIESLLNCNILDINRIKKILILHA